MFAMMVTEDECCLILIKIIPNEKRFVNLLSYYYTCSSFTIMTFIRRVQEHSELVIVIVVSFIRVLTFISDKQLNEDYRQLVVRAN